MFKVPYCRASVKGGAHKCFVDAQISIKYIRMSPALNESSVIRHFECGDAIEIHGSIIFDFYTGLSDMYFVESGTLSIS